MNELHTLDSEAVTYIPAEGFFVAPSGEVTVELFSDDIAEAIDIELEGSLSNLRWDTLQEGGVDITMSLAPDSPVVRSFSVAKKASLRFKCPAATGTVKYVIA